MSGALAAIELAQLALTISRSGLVLLADVGAAAPDGTKPRCSGACVGVDRAAFACRRGRAVPEPANEAPFDRILYGAPMPQAGREPVTEHDATETVDVGLWIAPWRGLPHP